MSNIKELFLIIENINSPSRCSESTSDVISLKLSPTDLYKSCYLLEIYLNSTDSTGYDKISQYIIRYDLSSYDCIYLESDGQLYIFATINQGKEVLKIQVNILLLLQEYKSPSIFSLNNDIIHKNHDELIINMHFTSMIFYTFLSEVSFVQIIGKYLVVVCKENAYLFPSINSSLPMNLIIPKHIGNLTCIGCMQFNGIKNSNLIITHLVMKLFHPKNMWESVVDFLLFGSSLGYVMWLPLQHELLTDHILPLEISLRYCAKINSRIDAINFVYLWEYQQDTFENGMLLSHLCLQSNEDVHFLGIANEENGIFRNCDLYCKYPSTNIFYFRNTILYLYNHQLFGAFLEVTKDLRGFLIDNFKLCIPLTHSTCPALKDIQIISKANGSSVFILQLVEDSSCLITLDDTIVGLPILLIQKLQRCFGYTFNELIESLECNVSYLQEKSSSIIKLIDEEAQAKENVQYAEIQMLQLSSLNNLSSEDISQKIKFHIVLEGINSPILSIEMIVYEKQIVKALEGFELMTCISETSSFAMNCHVFTISKMIILEKKDTLYYHFHFKETLSFERIDMIRITFHLVVPCFSQCDNIIYIPLYEQDMRMISNYFILSNTTQNKVYNQLKKLYIQQLYLDDKCKTQLDTDMISCIDITIPRLLVSDNSNTSACSKQETCYQEISDRVNVFLLNVKQLTESNNDLQRNNIKSDIIQDLFQRQVDKVMRSKISHRDDFFSFHRVTKSEHNQTIVEQFQIRSNSPRLLLCTYLDVLHIIYEYIQCICNEKSYLDSEVDQVDEESDYDDSDLLYLPNHFRQV